MHQTRHLQLSGRLSSRLAIYIGVMAFTIASIWILSFAIVDNLISHAHSTRGTIVTQNPDVQIFAVYTNDDGVIDSLDLDPLDNGIDPGHDKAVAGCHAGVDDEGRGQIWILDGYPSYTCQFWVVVQNTGNKVVQHADTSITAPAELTVLEVDKQLTDTLIKPAGIEIEAFAVRIEPASRERSTYRFRIVQRFSIPAMGTTGWSEPITAFHGHHSSN